MTYRAELTWKMRYDTYNGTDLCSSHFREDIEEWAQANLRGAYSVHTGSRGLTDEEKLTFIPEMHDTIIRSNWAEFDVYEDWLLFKLRWL